MIYPLHLAQCHFWQNCAIIAVADCIMSIFNLEHIYSLIREDNSNILFIDTILMRLRTVYISQISPYSAKYEL
jgi:hypothetical protein